MQSSVGRIEHINKTLNDATKAIDLLPETDPLFTYCENDKGPMSSPNPAMTFMSIGNEMKSLPRFGEKQLCVAFP